MLTYGGGMEKTREACCMAEQEGLSFREAGRVVEINLFLDECPRWNIMFPISQLSYKRCSCMQHQEGRKRQNVCATRAAKAA